MTRFDRRAVGMLAGTVLLVAVMVPLAAVGVVGTLIASRQPSNPIGWTLCGIALWGATVELGEAYGYVAAERGLPGSAAGEWLISWSWIVDVTAWVVVVLLFPDGRLPRAPLAIGRRSCATGCTTSTASSAAPWPGRC